MSDAELGFNINICSCSLGYSWQRAVTTQHQLKNIPATLKNKTAGQVAKL